MEVRGDLPGPFLFTLHTSALQFCVWVSFLSSPACVVNSYGSPPKFHSVAEKKVQNLNFSGQTIPLSLNPPCSF